MSHSILSLNRHVTTWNKKARYDYSLIESAALQIGDSDVLEVASWGEFWLNGVQSAELPGLLAGKYEVHHWQISDKEHRFTVLLQENSYGDGEQVVFNVFKDTVTVKLENPTTESLGTSQGMSGSFPQGIPVSRNGTILSFQDPMTFAEEWQVLPEEPKLFQDSDRIPQAPAKCIRPDPATTASRRRLGATVAKEAAMAACAHWEHQDACVYDVMATGDLELAQGTPY